MLGAVEHGLSPWAGTGTGISKRLASKLPESASVQGAARWGRRSLKTDFNGEWEPSTPETAQAFSAVGFFFGRYLHEILGVPVGLIDNAWGGSAAEAWVRREIAGK